MSKILLSYRLLLMFSHLPTHFQGAQDMKHSQKVAFLRSGRDHVALPSTPIAAEDTINVSTQQILAEIACLRSLQTRFHVLRRGPAGGAAASTQQQSPSESHPPSMPMAPCFNRFRWRLDKIHQNPLISWCSACCWHATRLLELARTKLFSAGRGSKAGVV